MNIGVSYKRLLLLLLPLHVTLLYANALHLVHIKVILKFWREERVGIFFCDTIYVRNTYIHIYIVYTI